MTEGLKGRFYPTAVGSLPYRDPEAACAKILGSFKEIPFWPQLVKRSFLENMYVQFSEGFPGVVVDLENKRIYVDSEKGLSDKIEALYEKVLKDDVDYFSIGRAYAEGLYAFLELLSKKTVKPRFLKGQITGPVSFGLTVTDEKKRALFYNPELKEALVKTLCMRARWQARKLKQTGIDPLVFIDEPYLTSIGSSFVTIKREEVEAAMGEIIEALHKEGSLCGVHCCGNTEWGMLFKMGFDVVSFDAYNYYETISLYPQELKQFLKKGGVLAWGIIPNTPQALSEDYDSLTERLDKALALLAAKGIPKADILKAMLVTPSCGLGLADENLSGRIIERTIGFSEKLRERYGKHK
ncbi:MAG: hypothetical protein PHO42_02440 [Candidatus Omnitrophica bacterium]|nr:hypothetical protein [Candidatus Omnitrophota bacterium]